jgi:flagellin
MSVINTNVKALMAQQSMTVSNRDMSKAMEQLSTGKRINSASDDSAGLAISERMTAQIRGLNQAVRNSNDAISMLETAEGAMVEVTSMMQRMRELAVQSSSDTNSTDDRANLDLEFQALSTEITRVRNTTQFNGSNLLNGASAFTFQIGTDASETMSVTIADIAGAAGTDGTAIGTDMAITAPTGTSGQIAALDFGGYFSSAANQAMTAGQNISLTVADVTFSYTITAADVADYAASGANNGDGVGSKVATTLAALINSSSSLQGVVNASATNTGTNILTLNGIDLEQPYSVSVQIGSTNATGVSGDVLTQAAASTAITTLDASLDAIALARGGLGASSNRLTHAADNLANISANTSASRSRVMDTDYAQATTELARTQIIQQAATAMLAQANQQPQSVLSLLQ